MPKWRCTICGYVYNPEKGDPKSEIKPGTPFEELPGDWVCPNCRESSLYPAYKDQFEMIATNAPKE